MTCLPLLCVLVMKESQSARCRCSRAFINLKDCAGRLSSLLLCGRALREGRYRVFKCLLFLAEQLFSPSLPCLSSYSQHIAPFPPPYLFLPPPLTSHLSPLAAHLRLAAVHSAHADRPVHRGQQGAAAGPRHHAHRLHDLQPDRYVCVFRFCRPLRGGLVEK